MPERSRAKLLSQSSIQKCHQTFATLELAPNPLGSYVNWHSCYYLPSLLNFSYSAIGRLIG